MTWSFPIGRLFGSELRVHATFFLLLAWIAAAAWINGGPTSALVNTVFVVALFACVVAHEFGHALAARRYGIETPDITLLPIGGLARLMRMPEKPSQEIVVALAGPAVNIVIWAVLSLVFGADTRVSRLIALEDATAGFLGRLAAVNLFLALFNMIPAFPMDGGRVFRAVLAIWLGRRRATRTAAIAGQVLAFVFAFLGLTGGNPVLVLIAVFVFVAARSESSDVALRETAGQLRARDAMITAYESLSPEDSLDAAAGSLIRTTQHEFPVIGPDGTLHGVLTRRALYKALESQPRRTPVAEVMTTDVPHVGLASGLGAVLDALGHGETQVVAVTDRSGRMLGYITRENIGELMVVSGGRDRR